MEHSRRGLWIALAGVLVLAIPIFQVVPVHDDLFHRMVADGRAPGFRFGPGGFYDFISPAGLPEWIDRGYVPWWSDPELSVRFLRPIPSWLLLADHRVFGSVDWIAHVQSILWMLALAAMAWKLFTTILTPRAAFWATLVYAFSASHAETVCWSAGRYALLAGLFGLGALWSYVDARQRGRGAWRAPLLLAVALLCGEVALGVVALAASYELIDRRQEPLGPRLRRFAPLLVVGLAYLGVYVALGFGVRGSGLYVDPMRSPLAYLATAARRLPILAGETLMAVPSFLAFAAEGLEPPLVVLGVLACLAAAVAFWRLRDDLDERDRAALGWLVPGSIAAMLPGLAGPLGGRLLPIALAGTAPFVAILALALLDRARKTRGLGRVAAFAAVGAAAFAHFGLGPLVRAGLPFSFAEQGRAEWRIAREAEVCEGGHVVILTAADPAVAIYGIAARLILRLPTPARAHVLSMAPQPHRVEAVTARGFELAVVGERAPNAWELVHRGAPWRAGEAVVAHDFTVTVLEASAAGPTRLRVEFDRPIAESDACFLRWQDGKLRATALPAAGESLELPHELGPMQR
jgi:hypothetical protein